MAAEVASRLNSPKINASRVESFLASKKKKCLLFSFWPAGEPTPCRMRWPQATRPTHPALPRGDATRNQRNLRAGALRLAPLQA